MNSITLLVNQKPQQILPGTSLQDALQQWGYGASFFAVACNGVFVAKAEYANTILTPNDVLDIVAPMAGG